MSIRHNKSISNLSQEASFIKITTFISAPMGVLPAKILKNVPNACRDTLLQSQATVSSVLSARGFANSVIMSIPLIVLDVRLGSFIMIRRSIASHVIKIVKLALEVQVLSVLHAESDIS